MALLLGCGSGGDGAPTSSVAPDDGARCAAETRELQDWLTDLDAAYSPVSLPLGLKLVAADSASPLALPGRLVVVGPRSVSMDDRIVTEAGEAEEEPARIPMMLALKRLGDAISAERTAAVPPSLTSMLLAVDGDAPWWLVGATLQELRDAGVSEFTLLFGDESRKVPSAPSSTVEEVLRGKTDLASLAPTLKAIYAACPQVTRIFEGIAESGDSAGAHAALMDRLPEAIGACGCGVEMAAVKASYLAMFSEQLRPVSGVAVRFPPASADLAALDPVLLSPADEVAWRDVSRPILAKASAEVAVTIAVVREDARKAAVPLPKKESP